LPKCPIRDRISVFRLALSKASGAEVFGSSPPAAVVGERGWPHVAVYFGEPPDVFGEEARRYDDPRLLWGLPLEEIARLRSYVTFGVRRAKTPWELGELPYVAVSARPVDVEIKSPSRPLRRCYLIYARSPWGREPPWRELGWWKTLSSLGNWIA
jgi:hypothetical protein